MHVNPKEYDRGQHDSRADIEAGSPKLFWPTRGSWGDLLTRLMQERYGVIVEHISDITTYAEVSYRKGYNDVTEMHIDDTYGNGSFSDVLEEIDIYRARIYKEYFVQEKTGLD